MKAPDRIMYVPPLALICFLLFADVLLQLGSIIESNQIFDPPRGEGGLDFVTLFLRARSRSRRDS